MISGLAATLLLALPALAEYPDASGADLPQHMSQEAAQWMGTRNIVMDNKSPVLFAPVHQRVQSPEDRERLHYELRRSLRNAYPDKPRPQR